MKQERIKDLLDHFAEIGKMVILGSVPLRQNRNSELLHTINSIKKIPN